MNQPRRPPPLGSELRLPTVEKVVPGKEIHLAELAGTNRYRVYEHRGTTTIKEGSVVIARIVPFFKGWMITTETVLSYPSIMRERLKQAHEQLQKAHGVAIPQFVFVRKHLEDHRRRMAGLTASLAPNVLHAAARGTGVTESRPKVPR